MDIASSTSSPLDRSSSIAAPQRSNPPTKATTASSSNAPPEVDRASISEEARNKLAAEDSTKAGGETPNSQPAEKPSETKKFVYGTLGLDRPTDKVEETPKDGYTYGRYVAAGVTVAALIALV